jgi:hypothetical protein
MGYWKALWQNAHIYLCWINSTLIASMFVFFLYFILIVTAWFVAWGREQLAASCLWWDSSRRHLWSNAAARWRRCKLLASSWCGLLPAAIECKAARWSLAPRQRRPEHGCHVCSSDCRSSMIWLRCLALAWEGDSKSTWSWSTSQLYGTPPQWLC